MYIYYYISRARFFELARSAGGQTDRSCSKREAFRRNVKLDRKQAGHRRRLTHEKQ